MDKQESIIKECIGILEEQIRTNRTAIEYLQQQCPHTETEQVDYMWRVGASVPVTRCLSCGKIVETHFEEQPYVDKSP